MEDALISPEGFMILSGAGLVSASSDKPINVHVAENTDSIIRQTDAVYLICDQKISTNEDATIYVMPKKNDEFLSEPFIGTVVGENETITIAAYKASGSDGVERDFVKEDKVTKYQEEVNAAIKAGKLIKIADQATSYKATDKVVFLDAEAAMVDYYTEKASGAQQIDITPDKFGGNYYLEASTLFRDQSSGQDFPAEFIIPNCKIQSNFTFSMASSGDPSEHTRLAA